MQTLASTLKFSAPRCKHVAWLPRNGEQGVARSAGGKAYAAKHACGQTFSSAFCSMTFCCCKINAAAILFCCCKINAAAILSACGYTRFNNACRNAAAILSACGYTRFNNACRNAAVILSACGYTRFNNACMYCFARTQACII